MAGVTERSLQVRLFVMLALAFLPALGLFWYATSELRRLETRAHEQDLTRYAQVRAAEYSQLLDDSRVLLAVLSEFPSIREARNPECSDRLYAALQHAPRYTTLSVIDRDGYLVCGALPAEGRLFLGDRAYFVLTSNYHRFSVGEYALGRITGKPTVGMAYPLGEEGVAGSVLAASFDLTVLADTTEQAALPAGTSLTVLDRNGTILVRSPSQAETGDTVGARVPESFPSMPEDMPVGVIRATDLDGEEALFAVAALRAGGPEPEGYLAVGRPLARVEAEADRVVSDELLFLAVAAIGLLGLAWVLGHYGIVRGLG